MKLLDTNVVAAIVNVDPPAVRDRFRAALEAEERIGLSTIVLFELHFGVVNSRRQRENAERLRLFLATGVVPLPFEDADAAAASRIRADLKAKGTPIGPYDMLIAGQAVRHQATLVTANTREFQRIKGLELEDWTRRLRGPGR